MPQISKLQGVVVEKEIVNAYDGDMVSELEPPQELANINSVTHRAVLIIFIISICFYA